MNDNGDTDEINCPITTSLVAFYPAQVIIWDKFGCLWVPIHQRSCIDHIQVKPCWTEAFHGLDSTNSTVSYLYYVFLPGDRPWIYNVGVFECRCCPGPASRCLGLGIWRAAPRFQMQRWCDPTPPVTTEPPCLGSSSVQDHPVTIKLLILNWDQTFRFLNSWLRRFIYIKIRASIYICARGAQVKLQPNKFCCGLWKELSWSLTSRFKLIIHDCNSNYNMWPSWIYQLFTCWLDVCVGLIPLWPIRVLNEGRARCSYVEAHSQHSTSYYGHYCRGYDDDEQKCTMARFFIKATPVARSGGSLLLERH